MPLDRRAALSGAAVLGLGAVLPACRAARALEGRIVDDEFALGHRLRDRQLDLAPRETRKAGIVIAGGGVAGLSAAWRLARAGCDDFVLLELGREVGGTARGGVMNGLRHPWGAHYLPVPRAAQRALVELLTELGLARGIGLDGRVVVPDAALVRAPEERLFAVGAWQEGLWLHDGASARDAEELARFEELVRTLAAPDARGARPFELPLARSSAAQRALDALDGATWARANGFEGERLRWYLDYATRDDFGCALEHTSAWALLHYFAARTSPASGVSGEFLTWPEGNQFLVAHLRASAAERIHTGALVAAARGDAQGTELVAVDAASGTATRWQAEHAILALPQHVNRHVLADDPAREARAQFRYGPWVVANLYLEREPTSRGFPRAWDNVLYQSASLGYVDATHQLDKEGAERVWTWYLPLVDADERATRAALLEAPWEHWRDLCLADLRRAHADIDACVTRLDVWRWGHAMVKPVPGFLWGDARARASEPVGRIHFAHTDLAGMALFEEAQWAGVRAAEEVLAVRGVSFESWL